MENICPLCLNNSNRLVKERCGHFKCRNCFIKEESGCQQCLQGLAIENPKPLLNAHETDLNYTKNKIQTEFQSNELQTNTVQCCKQSEREDKKNKEVVVLENIIVRPNTGENYDKDKFKRQFPSHIVKSKIGTQITYKCVICNKTFKSRSQQYYHIYCNNEQKKPYFCSICLKYFSTNSHLKYHLETHKDNKKFKCLKCPKVFLRDITYRRHIKRHENNIVYTCKECSAVFKDRCAYKAHCNKHENIFPYSCRICEKKFSLKASYIQHQITHSDKMLFQCKECKKQFRRKSTYKEHVLRHSNLREFSCSVCLKTFIDKKSFLRHKKIHEGPKTYQCTLCRIKSKRKDNLARHIKNMHPDENINESIREIEVALNCSQTEECIQSKAGDMTIKESTIQISDTCNLNQQKSDNSDDLKNNYCSVIKSVGNVKPVIIPNEFDNKSSKKEPSMDETTETTENQSNSMKKRKKKYDPCEIYRKILLVSNDDDSAQESSRQDILYHNDPTETNVEEAKTDTICEPNLHSNFGEIHWRKRTSQYFSTINL